MPSEMWQRYEEKSAELATIAAQMGACDYVDGWTQNDREMTADEAEQIRRMTMLMPLYTPFRNEIPRVKR